MTNNNLDSSNNFELKEIKIKEKLYTLFYELTSEIKGTKIEIDEEEYEENIRTTSVFQIIEYIYQTIQILIKKYKKENVKTFIPNSFEVSQFEKMLRKYENNERKLLKRQFQYKLHKDTLEYKLEEYMEMEEEFEEMKSKFKYEDGKFLENDRKDNEIIIIRQENTNLKKIISNLEKELNDNKKTLSEMTNKYNNLEKKLEDTEKDLNLFSNIDLHNFNLFNNGNSSSFTSPYGQKNHNINCSNMSTISHKNNNNSNINISQNSKNSFFHCKNNISEIKGITDIKILNLKGSKPTSNHKNKHIHELFVQNKNLGDLSMRGCHSSKNQNSISFNRNNSSNMMLEQKRVNLLSRYLSYKKINNGRVNNNSNNKIVNKNSNNKILNKIYSRHNNSCLRIIKKFPLKISQQGNLTNRESKNDFNNINRNNSSTSQNTKNQISISKIIKANLLKINKYNNNNSYNSNLIDKSSYSFGTSRGENEKKN